MTIEWTTFSGLSPTPNKIYIFFFEENLSDALRDDDDNGRRDKIDVWRSSCLC